MVLLDDRGVLLVYSHALPLYMRIHRDAQIITLHAGMKLTILQIIRLHKVYSVIISYVYRWSSL